MGDPQVERWRQQGRVYMWKNWHQPGEPWNLTADGEGCDALLELLDLMNRGKEPSKKTLVLGKPERPPDFGGERPFFAARQVTIKYPKGAVNDDHWQLREAGPSLVLVIGRSRLEELRTAIAALQGGSRGDDAIGSEDAPLRIW